MSEKAPERWRVVFTGRVQFVGFRYAARRLARELGLTGWVENLPDGTVALEAQGEPVRLRRLILGLKAQPGFLIQRWEIVPVETRSDERGFSVRGSRF